MDEVVARYQLDSRAFEDAVSEVWFARHVDRPSERATIRTVDLARDPYLEPAVAPFLADAKAASVLDHDNILGSSDVGRSPRPYVLGPDTRAIPWAAHVRDGIGATDAIALLAPLASALDTAAAAGVPHGAVHPRSIWVEHAAARSGAGRAIVTGFGLHHLLSVVAARPADCRSLEDFLYVAPELLRGGAPTSRSDQYSLAAALQHALTGRPPFVRAQLPALFGAHLFGHRSSLTADASDLRPGAELDRILGRALAKDPGDRFASCEQFMDAVVAWHRGGTGVPRTERVAAADQTPTPPLDVRPVAAASGVRRPTRTMALVAAAVAVGLVGLFGLFWFGRGPLTSDAELAAAERGSPSPTSRSDQTDPADPALHWRERLPSRVTDLQMTAAGPVAGTKGGAVLLDPATGGTRADLSDTVDSAAVAAGDRMVASGTAGLRAISVADGSVLWQAPVRGAEPTVAGETIYGVTDDDVPQLVATDATSGDRLWEFPRDEVAFPADATVAAAEDFVYLADGSAMYGILPQGAMAGEDTPLITASEAATEPLCLWRHEIEEDMWTSSLRAVDGGVVVANRSGTVCLRQHTDGAPVWCVPVRGVRRSEPAIYALDGQVIVATRTGVTAIDTSSGAKQWTRKGAWRRSVMADGRLIAIDRNGRIASIETDGGKLTRPVDTVVDRPSALAVDGDTLYVGQRDGTVLSLDLAGAGTG